MRKFSRWFCAALMASATPFLLVGCGGGEQPSTPTPPAQRAPKARAPRPGEEKAPPAMRERGTVTPPAAEGTAPAAPAPAAGEGKTD